MSRWLFLVRGIRMLYTVVLVLVHRNAGFDPSIRDGGYNGTAARPAWLEIEQGGPDGEASGSVRARNCNWWA